MDIKNRVATRGRPPKASSGTTAPQGTQKTTQRFAHRREAILAAASSVLAQKGVKGLTLAEVASSVGLATNSVTYYFKKKDDLAAECLLRGVKRFSELVDSALFETTPADRLRVMLNGFIELNRRVRLGTEVASVYFIDARILAEPHAKTVQDAYGALFRRAIGLFSGPQLAHLDEKQRNARTLLLLFLVNWTSVWIKRYDVDDYGRLQDRLLDTLLSGLAPARGAAWPPRRLSPPMLPNAAEDPGEAFLVAATRLINQHGYFGASVDRISSEIQVTKGAFYHHLDSKDDLVKKCFERTLNLIAQVQRSAYGIEADAWARLCAACSTLIELQYLNQGALLRIVTLGSVPVEIAGEMVHKAEHVSERFAGMVTDGFIDGSIRPVDAAIASQLITVAITSIGDISFWFGTTQPEEAVELYLKPLLFGLFCR